jgi:hypothetical protein
MMCLIGLRSLSDISVNSMLWRLPSLAPEHVAEAELESQKLCYYIADFMNRSMPGFSQAHVSQISQDMGIRVSRGIEGERTLEIEHVTSKVPVYFDDVIGLRNAKPWSDDGSRDHPFDADGDGKVGARSINGETTEDGSGFSMRYGGSSVRDAGSQGVDNILAGSGKTVSSRPQTTMRCGTNSMRPAQGAGVAAAVAALSVRTTHTIDIKTVQRELLRQGVYLGSQRRLEELGLA